MHFGSVMLWTKGESQRCKDVNCDIYVLFIDYQKDVDKIKRIKLHHFQKQVT